MPIGRLTQQQQQLLLAEMIGVNSDMPRGGEMIMGRGWDMLSGPMRDAVMAIGGDDEADLADAIVELRNLRPQLRSIGT